MSQSAGGAGAVRTKDIVWKGTAPRSIRLARKILATGRLAIIALPIGACTGEFIAHCGDVSALALEVIGDAAPQGRVGNVVRRIGGGRHVTARDLVLALRAGLDAGQLMRDGVVDRLIVAQLEMQEGMVLDCTPVAAEQGFRAYEID